MYLHNWLETLQSSLYEDLLNFAPELVLCFAIVLMLLLKLFRGLNRFHLGSVALCFTLVALGFSWEQWDPLVFQRIASLLYLEDENTATNALELKNAAGVMF